MDKEREKLRRSQLEQHKKQIEEKIRREVGTQKQLQPFIVQAFLYLRSRQSQGAFCLAVWRCRCVCCPSTDSLPFLPQNEDKRMEDDRKRREEERKRKEEEEMELENDRKALAKVRPCLITSPHSHPSRLMHLTTARQATVF
jgi:hypothetical protein